MGESPCLSALRGLLSSAAAGYTDIAFMEIAAPTPTGSATSAESGALLALPPKGILRELVPAVTDGDAVFDVQLTSNCIGAAVLVYEFAQAITPEFVARASNALHTTATWPLGPGVGLARLPIATLGEAQMLVGGRECRLTLLLGLPLDARAAVEAAWLRAALS